jgi:hypothetical protein
LHFISTRLPVANPVTCFVAGIEHVTGAPVLGCTVIEVALSAVIVPLTSTFRVEALAV